MNSTDRKTRIAYILEAGFEYFALLLVTSTFLGYILDAVGISDAWQGIILNVATFSCAAQLFALFFSNHRVKKIVTIGHTVNQLCFTLLYLLPIFSIPPALKTALLLFFLFLGHFLNNAVNPPKINWLMQSVPDGKRGSFTAVKEMISLAGGIVISVLLGLVADTFRDGAGNPTPTYYRICCLVLFLLTALHTVTLLVAHEKEPTAPKKRVPVGQVAKKILSSKDLLKVIGVGVIWNFASALSSSFFASYLREELAFSITVITVMTMAGSLCRIAASPLLGRIADRRSFAFSMTLCFAVMALAYACILFTFPGNARWLYLGYICLHSFAMGGVNSGVINLIYDYVVPEERTAALGIKNAFGGIVSFFTALGAGALLARIQANGGFSFFGITLYAQQVLAFSTVAVILCLLVYMRRVIAPMKRVSVDAEITSTEKEFVCK